MALFIDPETRVINESYIRALKDDITIEDDIIEKAKQGDAVAMLTIGRAYAAKQNTEKAILWFGASSALGCYESQLEIGDLLKETNPSVASKWYKQALDNGVPLAGIRIGDAFLERRQYRDAEKEFIKAANQGDPYCQNHLGKFYRDGYVTRKGYKQGVDHYKALDWFQKAADCNYVEAQYNIAQLHETCPFYLKDGYKAIYWYEKSKAGGCEVDDCIKRLNEEGYFYFPQKDNSSITVTETELPNVKDEVSGQTEPSQVKKESQALECFDPPKKLGDYKHW